MVTKMRKLRKTFDKLWIGFVLGINMLPMKVHAASVSTDDSFMQKFNAFLDEYKVFITAFMGFILLTSMIQFIYNVVMLSKNADNPQKRQESIHNLLEAGIELGIQGSISLFTILYFYLFR